MKRPLSSFLFFVKARQVSGDFANIVQRDVVALMAKEWHALSAAEKKVLSPTVQTRSMLQSC